VGGGGGGWEEAGFVLGNEEVGRLSCGAGFWWYGRWKGGGGLLMGSGEFM